MALDLPWWPSRKNERSGWRCKIWLHGLLTSAWQSIFFDCSSALHHHPANLSPYFSSFFIKKNGIFRRRYWHRSRYHLLVSTTSNRLIIIIILTLHLSCVGVWQNDRVEIIANDREPLSYATKSPISDYVCRG